MKIKQKSQVETEFQAQCRVIKWARVMAETGQEPRLAILHGDSSGVWVHPVTARKMKLAGAVKGFPDLFLPAPFFGNKYNGLFIELKREKGGKVSEDQKEMHDLLRKQGYMVVVCYGADDAISIIANYLGMQT